MIYRAVEFEAKVENREIAIPPEHQSLLAEGDEVKVIVLLKPKRIPLDGIIAEMTKNPIPVPGIRKMTRDEIHER